MRIVDLISFNLGINDAFILKKQILNEQKDIQEENILSFTCLVMNLNKYIYFLYNFFNIVLHLL